MDKIIFGLVMVARAKGEVALAFRQPGTSVLFFTNKNRETLYKGCMINSGIYESKEPIKESFDEVFNIDFAIFQRGELIGYSPKI